MNAQTNLPAQTKELPPLAKFGKQLEERAEQFKAALPGHITPEKMQRTIITAVQASPDLLLADRQTLMTSCMKAAQDGLLPDGREAALVIFNTKVGKDWVKQVQYMPMVYGLRKKILQSGEIASLQTNVVYRAEMEAGAFIYEIGMEPPIRHRPMLDLPDEELTDDNIVAAYSLAKLKDGTTSAEVMRRGEINKVRQMSQTGAEGKTYRDGKPKPPKGPWVDWFSEMARKTVMRRHSKTLPMSGDVIIDIEGQEHEVAANTARLLDAVEPDAPVSLPSSDQFDPNTGEIANDEPRTDSRGMTEVDEGTARELDSQQPNDGTLSGDNPDAGEGPADEQRGEAESQSEAAEQTRKDIDGPLDDDAPAWKPHVDAVHDALDKAKTKAAVDKAEGEFLKISGGLPDDVVSELEGKIRETRKAVMAKKEG